MGAPVQRSLAKTCAPAGSSKTGSSRPFSQTMGSLGRWTSVRLSTRTFSLPRWKPNMSASEDSPSRIRMAPFSTRPFHSTDAGAPVRATKMRARPAGCRWRPTEERISGHAPASSERTLKYGRSAACAGPRGHPARTSVRLTSKRIPEPRAEIVEVRPPRIARVDQVGASQQVKRHVRRLWQPRACNSESRPCLAEIGPVLALVVDGQVGVPGKLATQRLGTKGVSETGLIVNQEIIAETADKDGIQCGVGEQSGRFAAQG